MRPVRRDHQQPTPARLSLLLLLGLILIGRPGIAPAQPAPIHEVALTGLTSTLDEQIQLPGVTVIVTTVDDGRVVAQALSDDSGRYDVTLPSSGTYLVTASLDGFSDVAKRVLASPGRRLELDFDLQITGVQEGVDVQAQGGTPLDLLDTPMLAETLDGELLDVIPVRGENFDALLPLLPGVVRDAKGRLSVKGGQATQTVVRVNSVNVTDPVTGEFGTTLPDDAVDTVTLLPNPYAAEYGGFSAGVSEVETRRGTDEWSWSMTNFVPGLRFRGGTLQGIGKFRPRVAFSGPLVRGRVHIAQSIHYRNVKTKVPVRPDTINDTELESVDSFTQIDADLNDRHHVQATLSIFPRNIRQVNVDTFTPREVTPNLEQVGYNLALSERSILSPTMYLRTTLAFKRFDLDVAAQGNEAMVLHPVERRGSFFNEQHREARSFHLREALTLQQSGWLGSHVLKFGVDLTHANFSGISASRPVEVRRVDDTLSQLITYSGVSNQRVSSTDIGVFAQDRWRTNDRLLLELGARLDRNGVLEGFNLSPRAGFVFSVFSDGSGVLRGGAGLFFPETTLNVKAFELYETPTVRWYDDTGTIEQRVAQYAHEMAATHTPSSLIWNVEYFHRFSDSFFSKINFLRRTGDNELILHPVERAGAALLQLRSDGRSRYWEVEWTSRLQRGPHEMNFTYVRSRAQADLNFYDDYFGNFRTPIIRPNQFAQTSTDTSHRFLFRGNFVFDAWMVTPVFEGRQGFPYSVVDEDLRFVGPRNAERFPNVWVLDLHVQRQLRIAGFDTEVGVRVFHLLERDFPLDVQANIGAPMFGMFSNQVDRSIGLTFQITR